MSCGACTCPECEEEHSLELASVQPILSPPIFVPIDWNKVESATPDEVREWSAIIDGMLKQKSPINMGTAIYGVIVAVDSLQQLPLHEVTPRVEKWLRDYSGVTVVKGKGGGIFRSDAIPSEKATDVDNYTCGCGNSKINSKKESSCWSCGAKVVT